MDIYQSITDRIIAELENGTIPWQKPWIVPNGGSYNRITGKSYSLINQMLLSRAGEYATLRQWNSLGGKVKEGENGETIIFWKICEFQEEEDGSQEETKKRRIVPILRQYKVYHISQIDGVEPLHIKEKKNSHLDHINSERAESLFQDYSTREKIRVCMGSKQAYYSPVLDSIHLPEKEWFHSTEEYYSTAYHEMMHSTGHIRRLARAGMEHAVFGSDVYSREEMIAEIGSVALMHYLEIETTDTFRNSVAYIDGWLAVLREDKFLIISAASQAQKAVKYILGN